LKIAANPLLDGEVQPNPNYVLSPPLKKVCNQESEMAEKRTFEIVVLPEEEYRQEYEKAFAIDNLAEETPDEKIEEELEILEQGLRRVLSGRWEEDCIGEADYSVSDDWTGNRHHAVAIHSARILCRGYVESVLKVLGSIPEGPLWTWHTTIDAWHDDQPVIERGEFFLRGRTLYAPEDGNDYEMVFG
jgi:hypothetical protein